MRATLGADVVATLIAPNVLPAFPMGARIEKVPASPSVGPTRVAEIVSYWRAAAYDPVTGLWTVVLDAPLAVGDYVLAWRTSDPEPPEMEVLIPLAVSRSSLDPSAFTGPYPWAPTPEQVAANTPAYTHGGIEDDREAAGEEQLDFTEDTNPTRSTVETLIGLACDEIAGRVAVPIKVSQFGLARVTAIDNVKARIASDKQAAGTDDAQGEYRSTIARFLTNLEQLTANCRRPSGGRLR